MDPTAATDLWMALDGAPEGQSFVSGLIPIVLILGIIYVLIIRPQQKEQQEHDALIASLAVDDLVVTKSGLHGRIVVVNAETVMIEAADKVRLEFDKAAILRRMS